MALRRIHCPSCSRLVSATSDDVGYSVGDPTQPDAPRKPYAYLRRHKVAPGGPWCRGTSALLVTAAPQPQAS